MQRRGGPYLSKLSIKQFASVRLSCTVLGEAVTVPRSGDLRVESGSSLDSEVNIDRARRLRYPDA